jgi:LysM repeat protein
MKFNYLFAFIVIAAVLTSCKSKKQVVHSTTKKTYPSVIQNKKDDVVVIENKNTIKSEVFNSNEEYINFFKDAAMQEMKTYKIPASITLAQGILESSGGNSDLTKRSNNHFGIKCHKGWEGAYTFHDDDEKGECFRVYKDPNSSYRDHSLFLTTRSRYSKLFLLENGDYISWAYGLKDAGYATDKRYPDKLISLIEKYELYKYDTEVLGSPFIAKRKSEEIIKITDLQQIKEGVHIVKASETLYSISKLYGISVEALQQLNGLSSTSIAIGQELILQNTSNIITTQTTNQLKEKTHSVVKGDTLYSISKIYGISVDELKTINNLNSNELSIGQILTIIK